MKKHFILLLVAAVFALWLSATAHEDMKPNDQIGFRKATFKFMTFNMGRIKKNLKASDFDPEAVKIAAQAINAAAATHIEQLFGENTKESNEYNVKARPEIWMMKDEFNTLAEKHRQAAANMLAAAKTENQDNIRAAFKKLAKSCKTCHQDFKSK